MNSTSFFRKKIKKNQKAFLKFESDIKRENDIVKKCEIACIAANFATTHCTDIFSSEIIESAFLKLAQEYSTRLCQDFNKNTVLHVMSQAYMSGGHTRCVERWVEQMPNFVHSCVVLNQNSAFPEKLKLVVENSGGKLGLYNTSDSMLKRALRLREYASSFEYIVLHINMDDPIALIAFGTPEFKRPVLFFNHADHIFWLGISISDYVADLNSAGHDITLQKKGAKNASILGIPVDNIAFKPFDQKQARQKIGISDEKKIIFSSGSSKKYHPLGKLSFYNIVSDVVTKDKNIVFFIMGVDVKDIFWSKLKRKFPDNLFILNSSGYEDGYKLYLSAADLVIDSYPIGGGTAIIDAVKVGKPVLSLNTFFQSDFLTMSKACCHSYQDFLENVSRVLNDEDYNIRLREDVQQRFQSVHNKDVWRRKCEDIFLQLSEHRIHKFDRVVSDEISFVSMLTFRWIEPIRDIWDTFLKNAIYIRFSKGRKVIRFFGFYIVNKNNIV